MRESRHRRIFDILPCSCEDDTSWNCMNLWVYIGTVVRHCWDSHQEYSMNTRRCGTCHSLNWFCSSDHDCHFPSMFLWSSEDVRKTRSVTLHLYLFDLVCTSSLDAFIAFRIPVLGQLVQHGGTIWRYHQLVRSCKHGHVTLNFVLTLERRSDARENVSQLQQLRVSHEDSFTDQA